MATTATRPTRRELLRLAGLGGVAAAGISLAGCSTAVKAPSSSSSGAGARTGKELLVYMNAAHVYDAYQSVFDDFAKAHSVKVTVTKLQWADMQAKLTAGFLAGDVPDLCEDSGTAPGWGIAGDVLNLDDLIAKDGAAMGYPGDFQTAAVDFWKASGHVYAIPLHLTCNGLILYNKSMLSAAGVAVPTTWTQFRQAARTLTRNGVHGCALNQDSSYFWPWMLQSGAHYFDTTSKQFLMPTEDTARGLQLLQNILFSDRSSPLPVPSTDPTGPQKLLSSNKAAMIISGPWDIAPIRKTSPDITLGVGAPLHDATDTTSQAGAGLMIPAKAQNRDLAWELLKQLTAVKVELAATKEAGMTMPRKSWASASEIRSDATLGVVASALPHAVNAQGSTISQNKNIASINSAFTTAWQQIAIQRASVDKAIDTFRATVKSFV